MKRGFLVTVAIFLFGSLVVVAMHAASWFFNDSNTAAVSSRANAGRDGDKADSPPTTPTNPD